jgi:hypothetical protein
LVRLSPVALRRLIPRSEFEEREAEKDRRKPRHDSEEEVEALMALAKAQGARGINPHTAAHALRLTDGEPPRLIGRGSSGLVLVTDEWLVHSLQAVWIGGMDWAHRWSEIASINRGVRGRIRVDLKQGGTLRSYPVRPRRQTAAIVEFGKRRLGSGVWKDKGEEGESESGTSVRRRPEGLWRCELCGWGYRRDDALNHVRTRHHVDDAEKHLADLSDSASSHPAR